jgi:hypothetical protein
MGKPTRLTAFRESGRPAIAVLGQGATSLHRKRFS